jgi:hypothetical protein
VVHSFRATVARHAGVRPFVARDQIASVKGRVLIQGIISARCFQGRNNGLANKGCPVRYFDYRGSRGFPTMFRWLCLLVWIVVNF